MPKFQKEIIPHNDFYVAKLILDPHAPFLLYLHGGPGLNGGVIEHLILNNGLYDTLNYNIIIYDQRACGRSKPQSKEVTHRQNIVDLINIINFLGKENNITPTAMIGHSYGAKLLYDFYCETKSKIPGIFISTATTTTTPRLNNLILDLNYLKRNDLPSYQKALLAVEKLTAENLWEISEELAPLFFTNKDRIYYYWANLEAMKLWQALLTTLDLPMNKAVFHSVRKELYSENSNPSVGIEGLPNETLWINGFQDYIMNSPETLSSSKVTLFQKSAHYPHVEEPERFCFIVSQFCK
jgi:proline iminopeptidase